MNQMTRDRLFGFRHAFDDRVTVVLTLTALILFLLAPLLIFIVTRAANSTSNKRKELWDRYRSWIWLAAFILIPILAGAFWTILAVGTLSFLCYREYARITGLFRERTISLIVAIGILLITFAALDNWYRLFVALFPLIVAVIATGGLIPDQPKGYIQRVGLGVLRSEEHTSELQSHSDLVCRLLLEKKKKFNGNIFYLMIQITNYYITACCE